ncbi:MAG: hypothetical protein L3K10_06500 [Thermoplasmata archaeon]|jgi:hypothetical protein|nr:hypothetical protein [Thermoplasmata archaeon]
MVSLQSGELLLKSAPVVSQGTGGVRPGTLSLTNFALVFEGPGGPPPGEGWGPPADPSGPLSSERRIGLWRCRGASVVNGPGGPGLQVDLLARTLFFHTQDLAGWAAAITEARAHAPPPPPDVQARRALKRGEPPPQPRCSYCGKLSPAGSTKCTSCGAPF